MQLWWTGPRDVLENGGRGLAGPPPSSSPRLLSPGGCDVMLSLENNHRISVVSCPAGLPCSCGGPRLKKPHSVGRRRCMCIESCIISW